MPLDGGLDLELVVSECCGGYVGADFATLAREASMSAIRESVFGTLDAQEAILSAIGPPPPFSSASSSSSSTSADSAGTALLSKPLVLSRRHFLAAAKLVVPSLQRVGEAVHVSVAHGSDEKKKKEKKKDKHRWRH
jgi:SpoVK/Ycf46/Vps4 family AAA+-type ATPase